MRRCLNKPDPRPAYAEATIETQRRSWVSTTAGTSINGRHYRRGQSNRDCRSTDCSRGDIGCRVCCHYRRRTLHPCSSRTCERLQAEDRRWDYGGVRHSYSVRANNRSIGDQLGSRHSYGCTGRYYDNRRFTGGGGGVGGRGGSRC